MYSFRYRTHPRNPLQRADHAVGSKLIHNLGQGGLVRLAIGAEARVITLRIIRCCFNNRAGIIFATANVPGDSGADENEYQEDNGIVHLILLAGHRNPK
jgi:hypothetical protein